MSDDPNKRKFHVNPAHVIRQCVREHERKHGYFNVVDDMVDNLESQIRIWYEFERRHEISNTWLDEDGDPTLSEDGLELPEDIGSISPLGSRAVDESGVMPVVPPIAVNISPPSSENTESANQKKYDSTNDPEEGI